MKTIICVFTDDGYLLGATEDLERGDWQGHWPIDWAESIAEFRTVQVPDSEVDKFLKQGTSDQVFSDGYEAATALDEAML